MLRDVVAEGRISIRSARSLLTATTRATVDGTDVDRIAIAPIIVLDVIAGTATVTSTMSVGDGDTVATAISTIITGVVTAGRHCSSEFRVQALACPLPIKTGSLKAEL